MSGADDAEQRCSVVAERVGEPLAGTAPRARAWLVIEQPGPYGFNALTHSHLPAPVRSALGALPKDTGTTVLLARHVGRHADDHAHVEARRFWFAHTTPGGVRMRSGVLDDAALLRPDLASVLVAAAHGELPPWGERSTAPLLLVCTNARRDVCCALTGRPVAEALGADPAYSADVLEVSHLGGHRFAPTALLLPAGLAYGRLDVAAARSVLDAARRGEVGALDHLRGRTALPQAAQAAAIAVRRAASVISVDGLDVLRRVGDRAVPIPLRWDGEGTTGLADTEVRHDDGRAWRVVVDRATLPQLRAESCGKDVVEAVVWNAREPQPLPAWR